MLHADTCIYQGRIGLHMHPDQNEQSFWCPASRYNSQCVWIIHHLVH